MKHQKNLYLGVAIVLVVIVGGLIAVKASNMSSSSSNMAQIDTGSAVATNAIAIQDYMFSPMVIKVKVGTKVTWTNKDSVHHSVNADTASADAPNSSLFGQNETYSFTFRKAGTYSLHCDAHPYMHATVIVTAS